MIELIAFLAVAHTLPAAIYGMGELNCGDYDDEPIPCDVNAVTATGAQLEPEKAQLALSLPKNKLLPKGMFVWLQTKGGKCVKVEVVDKANEKWIGRRFGDLTPGAVRALGHEPTEHWSAPVFVCGKTFKEMVNG